jgi:hypothetical protein
VPTRFRTILSPSSVLACLLVCAGAACSSSTSKPGGAAGAGLGGSGVGGAGGGGGGGGAAVAAVLSNPVNVTAGSDPTTADGTVLHPFATIYDADTAILAATTWTGGIVIHAGQYQIPTEVVTNPRATLLIEAGAQFFVGPNISFHVQNDVQIMGTADNTVLFTWMTAGMHWGSFTNFTSTSQANIIQYTIFEHGGETNFNGIAMTGMLSLNGAAGHIHHNEFRFSEGDDSFGIAASGSLIENNYFHDAFSDCLDTGHLNPTQQEVRFNRFEHCGNDSVDVGDGETNLYVHDNIMIGSGDKGASIGETSFPLVMNNIMVGCNIGVAIKDGSDPIVKFNTLYANNVGLGIYESIAGDGAGKGTFSNNIVWGSLVADVVNVGGSTVMSYNCIQDDTYQIALDPGSATMPLAFTGLITQTTGCADPLFAAPPVVPVPNTLNGTSFDPGDLHLKSAAGRFVPNVGTDVRDGLILGTYVVDAVTSPALDKADPAAPFDKEPLPNGGRADLGAYGDSSYASKSAVPLAP